MIKWRIQKRQQCNNNTNKTNNKIVKLKNSFMDCLATLKKEWMKGREQQRQQQNYKTAIQKAIMQRKFQRNLRCVVIRDDEKWERVQLENFVVKSFFSFRRENYVCVCVSVCCKFLPATFPGDNIQKSVCIQWNIGLCGRSTILC